MDDEFHFILVCSLYDIFCKNLDLILEKTCATFQLKNDKIMTNLGKYINDNLKIRDDLLP